MDTSKILLILCCFALAICLVLSITALAGLRNAVAESNTVQDEASVLVDRLGDYLEYLEEEPKDSLPTVEDVESDAGGGYVICEVGGKIALYRADGYQIRTLEVDVQLLPQADREALKAGIQVQTLKEADAILQDYTA